MRVVKSDVTFVVAPAFLNQPVHQRLRHLLAPFGYRERLVGGYALLTPLSR